MGIHIHHDRVSCLWVENTNSKPKVLHARFAALPSQVFDRKPGVVSLEDPDTLAETLQAILPPEPHPHRITLLIPDYAVMFHILETDTWPRRAFQQSELIRWQLRQQLPHEIDNYRLSWQVIERLNQTYRIAVLASWKTFLTNLEALLARMNITPGWTIPGGLALENLAMMLDQFDPSVSRRMMITWSREHLSVALFDHNHLLFRRTRALTSDSPSDSRALFQAIHLIMIYVRDYYPEHLPEKVDLVGPDALTIAETFSTEYGIPAEPLIQRLSTETWPRELLTDDTWLALIAAIHPTGGS